MTPELQRVLEELERIGAMRALQAFLTSRALPSGRSWETVSGAVSAALAREDIEVSDFLKFFAAVRCSSRKTFTVYETNKELLARARRLAESPADQTWNGFPVPLAGTALEARETTPSYAGAIECDGGLALAFCSRGTFSERVEVPEAAIREDYRRTYEGVRLSGERQQIFQSFDVVFVPDSDTGFLQIRIDAQQGRGDIDRYREQLEDRLVERLELSAGTLKPIDVFPAVRSIYNAVGEGRIVQLYHDCSTGTSRREIMRSSSDATVDLRFEAYHAAGIEAVEGIDPYRLSVEWMLEDGRRVTAMFPGTMHMLHVGSPLYYFYIEGFPTDAEIDHVIGVISRHVSG